MIYGNAGGIRDPSKQDLALEFCRKQNSSIIILTETYMNDDQIHQTRNNWLDPIFFSSGDSHTKRLLAQLHRLLKVSLRLTLILGDFNNTTDKIDKDVGNKTQYG